MITLADSSVLEDVKLDQVVEPAEPGDHDTFSHYVSKKEWGNVMLTGGVVTALCGKQWYPTKDAKRYPVCPECKELWEKLSTDD
ncbi:hypothetical protein PBI_TRISCUIT_77 [Microbacterium phage Triscuit]|nr:hypothetical protein PBI_TRISCUIT_77 [Microbacterium phage Triscuit]